MSKFDNTLCFGHTTQEMESAITKGLNKMYCIQRVRNRMQQFYDKYKDGYIYFATFTFDNLHYFPNLKSFTQYLRRNNLIYCLYPDYGELNQRYHLHGFVVSCYPLECISHGDYRFTSDYFNDWGFNKLIECNGVETALLKYCFKYSVKFSADDIDKKYTRLITNDVKRRRSFSTF